MTDYLLADDLSGALDAAAAFHEAGQRVRVLVTVDAWDEVQPGELVAVNTETRNALPTEAAMTVRRVLEAARARGGRLVYKKIDSTLRGPIAAELEAVLVVDPALRVLLAPANPRVGRTVRDGILRVHGVPVSDTPFGQDPIWPLRTSAVRDVLGSIGPRTAIPDTTSEDDFYAAVAEMQRQGGAWLPVGSGGLARVIAQGRGGHSITTESAQARPPEERMEVRDSRDGVDTAAGPNPGRYSASRAAPVLMVAGSAHPLNRSQLDVLQKITDAHVIEVPLGSASHRAATVDVASVRSLPQDSSRPIALRLPEQRGDPRLALDAVVSAAAALIRHTGIRRIFVTGGETAFALCTRLGLTSLVYQAELEPGLALSKSTLPTGVPVTLAIKPGGFGNPQTWHHAWTALAHS